MLTSSAKSKGRRWQQAICKALLTLGEPYGLAAGDLRSTSMGCSGLDCLLSPAAVRVFGRLDIECKAVEKLNVATTFYSHHAKYPGGFPLLAHTKNHKQPLVTMLFSDFIKIYTEYIMNTNKTGSSQ